MTQLIDFEFTAEAVETIVSRGISRGKFGWGGRIRTFTVLINSEVSYQLDHAPVVGQNTITIKDLLHCAKAC